MSIDVDGGRVSLYKATWMLSGRLPCTKELSVIKECISEAHRKVVAQANQIHGAIGFTKDHDLELYFGDADFHRKVVARQLGF